MATGGARSRGVLKINLEGPNVKVFRIVAGERTLSFLRRFELGVWSHQCELHGSPRARGRFGVPCGCQKMRTKKNSARVLIELGMR